MVWSEIYIKQAEEGECLYIKIFVTKCVFRVFDSVYSDLYEQEMGFLQSNILSITLFFKRFIVLLILFHLALKGYNVFVDTFSLSCSSQNLAFLKKATSVVSQ